MSDTWKALLQKAEDALRDVEKEIEILTGGTKNADNWALHEPAFGGSSAENCSLHDAASHVKEALQALRQKRLGTHSVSSKSE